MRKYFKLFMGTALATALIVALPAGANHNGTIVEHETIACGETTFSATIADAAGTHVVTNMHLVVSVNGTTDTALIPTDGTAAEITVGPFDADTTIDWRVWGGDERDYDDPLWTGYNTDTFTADINAYGDANGFAWVLAGPEDENPFVTWNQLEVEGCVVVERSAEITAPLANEEVSGSVDFVASLTDDDEDGVEWAVREGACDLDDGTAVFGNVGGPTDTADIDQTDLANQTFMFTGDMSAMTLGTYCFIYDPIEDDGEEDIRETVEFTLVEEDDGEGEEETNVPALKAECKAGGWMTLTDHDGMAFKNQGQCVSFVATGAASIELEL